MVMPIQATLRNAIIGGALLGMAHGMSVEANEDKITKGFNTFDAMGCMLLRECTDGVKQVHTMLDVSTEYDDPGRFTGVAHEFNMMVDALKAVGSNVYLADQKYFPDWTSRSISYCEQQYVPKQGIYASSIRTHECSKT